MKWLIIIFLALVSFKTTYVEFPLVFIFSVVYIMSINNFLIKNSMNKHKLFALLLTSIIITISYFNIYVISIFGAYALGDIVMNVLKDERTTDRKMEN